MNEPSTTRHICVYGASDDLIEIRGAVDEEFGAVYDGTTTVIVTAAADDGSEIEVRLRVEYGTEDVWSITEETATGLVTIVPARGEDESDDEDGCPGYSQKAIVRGGVAVRLEEDDRD
jgi:hypothetical protein